MSDAPPTDAILLIAHGSRRPQANADLHRLRELLLERPPEGVAIVEVGFLELAEPSIPDGFAACVRRGATRVRIVPYFLSMGVHMAEDLEEFREQFVREYPNVSVNVRPPLGLDAKVVDLVLQRCVE